MTDNFILEGIQKFLQQKVCPKIELLKPNDKDIEEYRRVNPVVHIGWIPPKLPEELMTREPIQDVPCIIVGIDEGEDDGQEAGLGIRISFVVYSPGQYNVFGELASSFDGYRDLINLIMLTRLEVSKAYMIEGITAMEKPYKWGMYQDQAYPYWQGWFTFKATCPVIDVIRSINEQYE